MTFKAPLLQSSARPSVLMLGAVSGLSPLGVTIMVPLLAIIAADFGAGFGEVQFLVSAYLFGLAVAQPFNGYLCDHFGRRPVMLVGITVFIITSFAAVWAPSLESLIVLRFIQAAGISVGTVGARAVVRDTRGERGAAQALAYITAAMGFAPVLAPIAGGMIGASLGWRHLFTITGFMGLLVLVWLMLRLPETLRPEYARPHWREWMKNYRQMLRNPAFVGYTLVFGFVQGCFFSFLAVGAEVFNTHLGISARGFGLWWGPMAIIFVVAATVGGRLYGQGDANRIMQNSVIATLGAGWLALAWVWLAGVSLPSLLVPMAVLMAVAGFASPGALAGAVNLYPQRAGTASGLSSAGGIVVGGLFTTMGGVVYDGEYLPVAWLIAISATLTTLSWMMVRQTLKNK